jgi:hypothetical protein
MGDKKKICARNANLKRLREEVLPQFLDPIPSDEALRDLFDRTNIRRFKTNPNAKRGGGSVYHSVAEIEKLFSRVMPKLSRN